MSRTRRIGSMILMLALALGVACSNDAKDASGDAGPVAVQMAPEDESGGHGAATSDLGAAPQPGGDGQSNSSSDLPDIGPAVIKTAKIEIEVDQFGGSIQDVVDAAEAHGGFVLSSRVGSSEEKTGTIVIRVPAEQFEVTLGEIKDLAAEDGVKSERVSGQDVSQEFVDLESRLRNFRAQEAVLLGLMERATTIADSIRVQNELTGIQLEIEQIRGRLNFLDDQTQFSTISVEVGQVGTVAPEPDGTFEKAWKNAKDTFSGVISAVIIGASFLIPLTLLGLIALYIGLKFVRPLFVKVREQEVPPVA